jgi:hypothetical protein
MNLGAFIPASACRRDCSVVRFDKGFADGKTETQSAQLRYPALFESIENFRQ